MRESCAGCARPSATRSAADAAQAQMRRVVQARRGRRRQERVRRSCRRPSGAIPTWTPTADQPGPWPALSELAELLHDRAGPRMSWVRGVTGIHLHDHDVLDVTGDLRAGNRVVTRDEQSHHRGQRPLGRWRAVARVGAPGCSAPRHGHVQREPLEARHGRPARGGVLLRPDPQPAKNVSPCSVGPPTAPLWRAVRCPIGSHIASVALA